MKITPAQLLTFTLAVLLGVAVRVTIAAPVVAPFTPHLIAEPARMVPLPALPESVFSVKGWTKVHIVKPPLYCGPALAWGCYTYATRRLEMDTVGLDRWRQWFVLEHEMTHMAFGDADVIDSLPGADDARADANAQMIMFAALAPGKF